MPDLAAESQEFLKGLGYGGEPAPTPGGTPAPKKDLASESAGILKQLGYEPAPPPEAKLPTPALQPAPSAPIPAATAEFETKPLPLPTEGPVPATGVETVPAAPKPIPFAPAPIPKEPEVVPPGGGGGGGYVEEPRGVPARFFAPQAPSPPGTVERLGRHFVAGALGTAEGMGGALQWITGGALGKDFSDYMAGLRKDVTPEGEASFAEQLASGAGSMATFFIPGFGIARGLGIAARVAPKAAAWLGAGTMAVTEAATEAGQVYRDEVAKGLDPEKAGSSANWTFWLNLPVLTLTDKLAFFGNQGKALSRALRGMVMEGSQESLQEVISTWSKDEQQNLKNILTSGAVGALLGGGLGAIAKPPAVREVVTEPRVEEAPTAPTGLLPPEIAGGAPFDFEGRERAMEVLNPPPAPEAFAPFEAGQERAARAIEEATPLRPMEDIETGRQRALEALIVQPMPTAGSAVEVAAAPEPGAGPPRPRSAPDMVSRGQPAVNPAGRSNEVPESLPKEGPRAEPRFAPQPTTEPPSGAPAQVTGGGNVALSPTPAEAPKKRGALVVSKPTMPEQPMGTGVERGGVPPGVEEFMGKYGTARGVGAPEGLVSKPGTLGRALETGNLAAIIRYYGGFRSDSELIRNFEPEERKGIYLFSRKAKEGFPAQGPDELAAELRANHPEQFGHIENGEQLLRMIANKDIYKKANLDKMIVDVEEGYAALEKDAATEGYSPEDVARATAEDQELQRAERDAILSEEGPGEYDLEAGWPGAEEAPALRAGAPKPTALETRLDALEADYPGIDREKAATVLRALPNAEDGQIVNMAADPEMFVQVARGNLAASEKAQLLKKATDAGAQLGFEGMEGGRGETLFKVGEEAALTRGLTTDLIKSRIGESGNVFELPPESYPETSPYGRGWWISTNEGHQIMVQEAKDGSLKLGLGKSLGPDYAALGIKTIEGRLIAGSFVAAKTPFGLSSFIELAKGQGPRVLDHELWHAIERFFLTPKELEKITKKYGDNEELRARAYESWNPKEAPDTIFQKIKDFVTQIVKTITGYESAEDIFAKARSGELFGRGPIERGLAVPFAPVQPPEIRYLIRNTRFAQDQTVKRVEDMFERSETAFKELRVPKLKEHWENLKRLTIDTSANIKKEILARGGDAGRKVEMMHDLMRGASAKGESIFREVEDKIYTGLSKAEEIVLNRIIQARRVQAIEAYKPDLMHPEMIGAGEYQAYLDSIPQDVATKLMPRADEYFAAWQDNLTTARDAGLINDEAYQAMVNHEYSPRQFIQHIDPEGTGFDARGRKITVPESGIKKLKEGSDQLLNLDSRLMLAQGITRTQARIAKNEANKALRDLAKDVPESGIVRVAKRIKVDPNEVNFSFENAPPEYDMTAAAQKVIYKYEPLGNQETYIKFRENGQEKRLIMPDKFAREWVHSDPMISAQMATVLGYATGSKLLRAMATGMNPGFAITNIFRDIAHIWMTTHEYSSFAPKFTLQMGKDIMEVMGDAIRRKGAYKQYINEGGGMSFLTNQGQEARLTGTLGKIQHYLGWIGETSEILTRLALRNRALKNGLNPLEATWIARNYLDFSQGGSFSKAVDSAVPYLNASIQGTRGIFRAARTDPKLFTWKVAQIGILATGLYLANQLINPDGWDEVPENEKVTNWIITTPFSYTDEMGNKRYHYVRIAKDQGQRIFASAFEGALGLLMGKKVDGDQIASAISDFLPIVPNEKLPPALQAMLGYYSNKDFWRNKDIWQGPKVEASEEYTKYTNPVMVKAGELTGTSPERLGYALGSMVPATNTFVALVGGGIKSLVSDLPEKDRQSVLETISKPITSKFLRTTDPYTPYAKDIEELSVAESTMKLKQRRGLEKLIDANIDRPAEERLQIYRAYIAQQDPADTKRLIKEVKNYEAYHELTDRRWWLKLSHLDPEVRAEAFYKRYKNVDLSEQERLSELAQKLPGINSDRFKEKLLQLDSGLEMPEVDESALDEGLAKAMGFAAPKSSFRLPGLYPRRKKEPFGILGLQ